MINLILFATSAFSLVCKSNGLPFSIKSVNAYNIISQDDRAAIVRMTYSNCAVAPVSEYPFTEASKMFQDVVFLEAECLDKNNAYQFCQDQGGTPYSPYHMVFAPKSKKKAGAITYSETDPWVYVRGIEQKLKFFGPEAPLTILDYNETKTNAFLTSTKYKIVTLYSSTTCESKFLAGLYRRVLHLKIKGNRTDISVGEVDCENYPEQCTKLSTDIKYPFAVLFSDSGASVKIDGNVDSTVDQLYNNVLKAIKTIDTKGPLPTASPLPVILPRPTPEYQVITHPIQTRSRYEMCQKYNELYVPKLESDTPYWTKGASTSDCDTGIHNSQDRKDGFNRLNFYRWIVGTSIITDSDSYHQDAMEAATLLHNMGTVTHYPPKSAKCYKSKLYRVCSASELVGGTKYEGGPKALDGLIYEPDDNNKLIGHRRGLLNPFTNKGSVGCHGGTEKINYPVCIAYTDMISTPFTKMEYPNFVAYPPPGYFPAHLVPERWSLNSPLFFGKKITDFVITIKREDGQNIPVISQMVDWLYGTPDCLIFTIPNYAKAICSDGHYAHVEVLFQNKYIFRYDVHFTNCTGPIPTPMPTSTPMPTYSPYPTSTPTATPLPQYKYCFYQVSPLCNGNKSYGPLEYSLVIDDWLKDPGDIYVNEDIVLKQRFMLKGTSINSRLIMGFHGPGKITGTIEVNVQGAIAFYGSTSLGVDLVLNFRCRQEKMTTISHVDKAPKSLDIIVSDLDKIGYIPPIDFYIGSVPITNYQRDRAIDDGIRLWSLTIASLGGTRGTQLAFSCNQQYPPFSSFYLYTWWNNSCDLKGCCGMLQAEMKNQVADIKAALTRTLDGNLKMGGWWRIFMFTNVTTTISADSFPDEFSKYCKNYTIIHSGDSLVTINLNDALYKKVKHLKIESGDGKPVKLSFGNNPKSTTVKFDSFTVNNVILVNGWEKNLVTVNNLFSDLTFIPQIAINESSSNIPTVLVERNIDIPIDTPLQEVTFQISGDSSELTDKKGINLAVKGSDKSQSLIISNVQPTTKILCHTFSNLSLNTQNNKVQIRDIEILNIVDNKETSLDSVEIKDLNLAKFSADSKVIIDQILFTFDKENKVNDYGEPENKEFRNIGSIENAIIKNVTLSRNGSKIYATISHVTISGKVNLEGSTVLLLSNFSNDLDTEISIKPIDGNYPKLDVGVDANLNVKSIKVEVPPVSSSSAKLFSSSPSGILISGILRDKVYCNNVAKSIAFSNEGYTAYCSDDFSSILFGEASLVPTEIPTASFPPYIPPPNEENTSMETSNDNNSHDGSKDGKHLLPGAIAGIVIGVIVVVAACTVGVVFYIKKKALNNLNDKEQVKDEKEETRIDEDDEKLENENPEITL